MRLTINDDGGGVVGLGQFAEEVGTVPDFLLRLASAGMFPAILVHKTCLVTFPAEIRSPLGNSLHVQITWSDTKILFVMSIMEIVVAIYFLFLRGCITACNCLMMN